jgi:O-antigen/teichoic acid export membrane protein
MAHPMRSVLGNFWLLVRGRGAAAVMAFATTAFTARVLGPAEFGILVLIHTYAMLLRALLDFQTMDVTVRYAVPIHDAGDTVRLARLIKLCRRVDRNSSQVATALAVMIAPIAGFTMGLDTKHVILLATYSLVLLTTCTGTASGILRLYNRLDLMGHQMTVAPTIRFFGVGVAWLMGGSIQLFVVIWIIAYAAENFYLLWYAQCEYNKHIQHAITEDSIKEVKFEEFSDLRHFMKVAYWQSNMDVLPKHITTVLVGYILGTAEAGLLRLAREISSMLNKPATMIRQVVFLDLTRSWHQGSETFDIIAYRTAIIGAVLGSIFVTVSYFFGDKLLAMLLGQAFVPAAPVLTLMLLAATLELTTSPLRSAAYALGSAHKVLHLYIASTTIYLTSFVVLTSKLGLIGAGLAACFAAVIPLIGIVLLVRRTKVDQV